ncbi:hypothetical protein HJD18_10580 [Thermoleophilia bacterium SCSIO 60948]|nr:hypothetical protein HJD18_10580 [Thermoleophilia bacterium SCSIO 60948]
MSNEELVNAYAQGRVSRRTMIQGLVAAGVSTGAAVSYAHLLAPERAKAGGRGFADEYPSTCLDEYPSVDMLIVDRKIAVVRREAELRVRVRFSKSSFDFGANPDQELIKLTATARRNGKPQRMGTTTTLLSDGETTEVTIPLDNTAPLRGAARKTVFVRASNPNPVGTPLCRRSSPSNLIRIKGALN